jgi:ethanolaminephosphotransferase
MILHYLGLDHIGHKTGPQGPNMLPKQREMDGIVEMIYNAMASDGHMKDTLLVLAGDHGMNGGGNHGGSGPGETEPALLFASPKFATAAMAAGRTRPTYECPTKPKDGTEFHYYTKVEQSDLVPTLAGLMGLPISRNSLGVAIPELAGFLGGAREEVALLRRNAAQILRVVEATYGEARWKLTLEMVDAWRAEECAAAEGEAELACRWLRARRAWDRHDDDDDDDDDDGLHIDALRTFLLAAQAALSGTASSYNLARMAGGMVLTAGIVAATLASLPPVWPPSPVGVFFALASILYGIMMFASSYVEEEQQFWYWVTPAWLLALAVLRLPAFRSPRDRLRGGLAVLAALAVHRVQTRWNQTGQKHAGDADIAHTLFPDRHVSMWLLILATYAYVGVMLVRRTAAAVVAPELAVVVAAVVVLPALVFKLNFTQADAPELVRGLAAGIRAWSAPFDLVVQARVAFAALAAATLAVVGLAVASHRASWSVGLRERGLLPSLTERLHYLLMLFLITQTRAPNVPVLLGMEVQREAVAYLVGFESGASSSSSSSSSSRNGTAAPRVTAVAATVLLFSHVSFFCMGGSNSISSIDLSNAYNGVADYNIVAVGVLLFASNWTGPIWWCSAANLLLAHRPGRSIFAAPIPSQGLAKNGRSWIDDERKRMHEDALQAMMGPEKKTPTSVHGVWMQYLSCMTAFVAVSLLAVMAGCTALRTHLFIWTVFSPKYLYAMAWSMGWHLLVNVGLGSLWHRLSTVA